MSIWQDTNGGLHDDMDGEALLLPNWPTGLKKLTDAEVTLVTAKKSVSTPEGVRADRDARIQAVQWRVERWNRETRLGIKPTEDIAVLDKYIQALCAVPEQSGFPSKIKWPEEI